MEGDRACRLITAVERQTGEPTVEEFFMNLSYLIESGAFTLAGAIAAEECDRATSKGEG